MLFTPESGLSHRGIGFEPEHRGPRLCLSHSIIRPQPSRQRLRASASRNVVSGLSHRGNGFEPEHRAPRLCFSHHKLDHKSCHHPDPTTKPTRANLATLLHCNPTPHLTCDIPFPTARTTWWIPWEPWDPKSRIVWLLHSGPHATSHAVVGWSEHRVGWCKR